MARIKLGDIFEIKTAKGYAYFQYVHSDKLEGELIKVFNNIFEERPKAIEEILKVEDCYYVGFPLKYALKQKIVEHIGMIPIPKDFKKPRYTRSKHMIRGEFKGWHITDSETEKMVLVQELTEEQKQFSPSGIVNDTYLIERLEEGWTLDKWV